jgi:predicted transcriptional regulator
MAVDPRAGLGRRERQILEAVYRLGRASVSEVLDHIDDPPSYSAVRAQMRILEEKGHLRHEADGPRYVYLPVIPPESAGRSALRDLVRNFFEGSPERLVASLFEDSSDDLTEEELARLARLIDRAREEGR